jgi:hypothetical protein
LHIGTTGIRLQKQKQNSQSAGPYLQSSYSSINFTPPSGLRFTILEFLLSAQMASFSLQLFTQYCHVINQFSINFQKRGKVIRTTACYILLINSLSSPIRLWCYIPPCWWLSLSIKKTLTVQRPNHYLSIPLQTYTWTLIRFYNAIRLEPGAWKLQVTHSLV